MDKVPTAVEMVFQIKTIESLDLAQELLVLDAVLDLEWTDNRMNWSGFCPKNMKGCPSGSVYQMSNINFD